MNLLNLASPLFAITLTVLLVLLVVAHFLKRNILKRQRILRLCKQAAQEQLKFNVSKVLGMGREGVVFETECPNRGPAALKILFADLERSAERVSSRVEKLKAIATVLEAPAADGNSPAWPRVYDLGVIALDGGKPVGYQLLQKLPGKTLNTDSFSNKPLDFRLDSLREFLIRLDRLASAGVFVIHIDPDNVMVDPDGNLFAIDLDGFKQGPLEPGEWYRLCRRLAKSILTVLEARGNETVDGDLGKYIGRLRLLRDSTKREPVAKELQFATLQEFIAPIRDYDHPLT